MAASRINMTKDGVSVLGSALGERAFLLLSNFLVKKPIPVYADPSSEYYLYIVTSNKKTGVILCQYKGTGLETAFQSH